MDRKKRDVVLRLRRLHHAFDVCLRVLEEDGRNVILADAMKEIRDMFREQWPKPERIQHGNQAE